jgi:hypothetical protein
MIRTHVRNSIIHFCERTLILKKTPATFYLDEDEHTYTLKYSSDRYVALSVLDCTLGTGTNAQVIRRTSEHELDNEISNWKNHKSPKPTRYFLTEDTNQIRFYPTPSADSTSEIYMNTAVRPKRSETEVDEFLKEKWEEVIQAGALSTLLSIPNATWYKTDTADLFAREFGRGIRRARKIVIAGTGVHPGRAIPQSYINPGARTRRSTTWV